MNSMLSLIIERASWAALAAAGFAVLFNVPPRLVASCALNGALGFALRALLVEAEITSIELASLLAATTVSLAAIGWGQALSAPAVVFVIPGVIPLVPGALAFHAMVDLLSLTAPAARENPGLIAGVVADAAKVVVITGAMACGVAVPSLLLRHREPMT